jgi:hypothetical protein
MDFAEGINAAEQAHAADRATAPLRAAVARPLMGGVRLPSPKKLVRLG